tara:strand:- start:14134 stop:15270 length:1137 start_codon:yes stop_codon:yes gene_type:complete
MKLLNIAQKNILLFVEDPGALNGLLPIARLLVRNGYTVSIELAGYAKTMINLDLTSLCIEDNSVDNLINGKYDALITGISENRKSKAFDLICICRDISVTSFAFIDSPANPEYRFSGETGPALRFAPDYLVVVDEETRLAYKNLGFSDCAILVVEHPHIENIHSNITALIKQPISDMKSDVFGATFSNDIVVTFCSELSEGLQEVTKTSEYTLKAPTKIVKRTDVVIYNFLAVVAELRDSGFSFKTVLRLHPKQSEEDVLLSEHFDFVSTGGDSIKVCIASDIVVGMTSMILAEAFELGTSVISLLPRSMEIDWMHVDIREKIAICVTHDNLMTEMRSLLNSDNWIRKPKKRTESELQGNLLLEFFEKKIYCSRENLI